MALDKQELIFKKVFAGKASTDNDRAYFEEAFNGRLSVFSPDVWSEASSIPNTPSIDKTGLTTDEVRTDGVIAYIATASMAYVPGTGVDGTAFSSSIQDWIPFNYGDGESYNYVLKNAAGTRIFASDSSNWTFDTETGVLIFHDTLPSGVSSVSPPVMAGYFYTGKKLNTGLVTGEITASGAISASGHLFASLSFDASVGTNGVVMYDNTTGQLYYTGSYGGGGGGGAVDLTDLYDWTSSIDVSIGLINSFTESVDNSITLINNFTESVDNSITLINSFTGSANTSITALNTFTGSIQGTANQITTDLTNNVLTIGLPDDVIIQNKLTILGDLIAENYIVSSSTMYMTTSFFDGDTQFGDTMGDTHQFTGSVYVTGSVYFGADQTTTHQMTGSLYVSGALYFDYIDGGTF